MGNIALSRRNFICASGMGAGLGYFFLPGIGRVQADPRSMRYPEDYYGRLCFNENPLGPSPKVIMTMMKNARMAHRYPDWFNADLEKIIADFHGVLPENVCVGPGAMGVIKLTAFALFSEGDEIIVPYPSYKLMTGQALQNGANVVQVPVNADYTVNLSAMMDAVTAKTKMVYFINPSNPLSRIVPKLDLEAFIRSLPQGVITVINECYYQYVHSCEYGSMIPLVKEGLPVIVINTFSKAYGLAGARIGYSLAPPELSGMIGASQIWGTVTRSSQAAAEAALKDIRHLKRTIWLNDEAKDYLYSEFDAMGLFYIPSEASYILFDTGTNDAYPVALKLMDKGYMVRPGDEWDMPSFMRISTGLMKENKGFIQALKEVLAEKGTSLTVKKSFALNKIHPNPFTSSCNIEFSVKDNEKTKITIFSSKGKAVRTIINTPLRSGKHTITWDGNDAFGNPVNAGTYTIQLNQTSSTARQKLEVIR